MLKNKKLSILGDSISTYVGISNDGGSHPSIEYNPCFYRPPFPLEKTYWMLVCEAFGLTICVNNSWSGGNLSGRNIPAAGVNRAEFLHNINGDKPDLVIVFMGMNDLGRGVPVDVFATDYEMALDTIKKNNFEAKICCVNMPDRTPEVKARTIEFNKAIEAAVKKTDGCFIADLFSSRLNNDGYYMNTVDGLHPDEDGMRIIAEVVIGAIRENI